MQSDPAGNEVKFDRLLTAYREACVSPEPSANFMPQLWDRIEGSQSWTRQAWKWANSLTVAAALASLFFVMMQMMPRQTGVFASATYLETLADQHEDDAIADLAMIQEPATK
jgi:hypothetical protein